MKRCKNLYEDLSSFENLYHAARKAQCGKRYTPSTLAFNHNLEYELMQVREELRAKTYTPGSFRTFLIYDAKPRLISAAPYRDRIVHHAICNIIEPIYEGIFIYDSYACRPGKGTHAAVDRFTSFARKYDYVLKCDIQKYFPSVDHEILKQVLRRKIGCQDTLWLLDTIIDNSIEPSNPPSYFESDDLFSPWSRARGLPIGNQTSQFFANVYLKRKLQKSPV